MTGTWQKENQVNAKIDSFNETPTSLLQNSM